MTFVSQAGRFRCHWSHSKARKSATGKLQEPKHEIADADTGKVLESKKSLVLGIIEAKTGMDFDRFTRSMLLAQGGFDSFLKANSEEKSKILEQITGTTIYSDISVAVHERARTEKLQLQQLQQQLAGIELLSEEEVSATQLKVSELEQQTEQTQHCITQWQQSLSAYQQQAQLQQELNTYQSELNQHRDQQGHFQNLQRQIESGQRAANIHGQYQKVVELRRRSRDLDQEQQRLNQLRPSLLANANKANQQLVDKDGELAGLRHTLAASEPVWQQVRELDYQQQMLQQALSDRRGQTDGLRHGISQVQVQLESQQQQSERLHQAQQQARSYLQQHQTDQRLVQDLAAIESRYQQWQDAEQQLKSQQQWLSHTQSELATANQQLVQEQQQCRLAQQNVDTETNLLAGLQQQLSQLLVGKLLREYRAEKDRYEQEAYYLRRIESLEQQRQTLQDGDPCPLCGALEHPYAHGQIPAVDQVLQCLHQVTELLVKADELQRQMDAQKSNLERVQQRLYAQEKQLLQAQSLVAQRQSLLAQGEQSIRQLLEQQTAISQRLLQDFSDWSITSLAQNIDSLMDNLKERRRLWIAAEERLRLDEQQIQQVSTQIERHLATLEANRHSLSELEQQIQQDEMRIAALRQQRVALFGQRQPEQERALQLKHIQIAEQELAKARERKDQAQAELARLETQLESCQQHYRLIQSELHESVPLWEQCLSEQEFTDENAFLGASMAASELANGQQQLHQYELRQQQLNTMISDRQTRLGGLVERLHTARPKDQLESQLAVATQQLEQLREQNAQLKVRLQQHELNLSRVQSQQQALQAQQQECQRWDHLHSLIGSADGKKYRNFAQGLTFELMVAHANRQLERMSDRYLLVRDEHAPLELNIIDNYQAGDIRSTKNLSGGESFIISLALALGLSKMSSRKVRVDSLFLDEGFGTLDEDALDVALDTLSSLHEEDKLIGIISHVAALKERISTQIRISPKQGGRSMIQGPGCKQL